MPVESSVAVLRMLLAEPSQPLPATGQMLPDNFIGHLFSDDQLEILINHAGTMSRAAQIGWAAKAAFLTPLVDIDESGVNRRLSQMHKQATAQVTMFKELADYEDQQVTAALRVEPKAGSPWGKQQKWFPGNIMGSYLIGDVSRAGAGGSIIFIEVPVPDTTTTPAVPALPNVPAAKLDVTEVIVPTQERWDMNIERDRSFTFVMDYVDPTTGLQVDQTGWTAALVAFDQQLNAQVLHVGAPGDPGSLLNDVNNHRFVLHYLPADTSAFAFDSADYEVIVFDGSDQWTMLRGTMNISTGD